MKPLLVGAMVLGLGLGLGLATAVDAKPDSAKKARAPKPPPVAAPDTGLGPRDVYLEADQLIDDRDNQIVTAVGHAEARYQGRTIRAKKIVYNALSGETHASGDVVIVNPDQTQTYAQEIDLDDEMNTGVALAFAARLQNNVTITAGAAIRRNEAVVELNHGGFTPCATCKADGTAKTPSFSIQATRILQDHARQVIYYRNAVIRVFGVPVFYAPIFWHPDPAAERRSGLLTPLIHVDNKRGLSYEQPILWVINKSADLIVSPQFNTTVNPFVNLHYRQRFYSGTLDVRAGVSYDRNFDNNIKFGDDSARSYILGKGQFDIDKTWVWGFGAERVSDPALFRRYSIHEIYSDRGPYGADTARLASQLYTQRQDNNSYISVAALTYQSLRPVGTEAIVVGGKTYYESRFESAKTFPTIAPLVEGHYDHWLLGGRLELSGSAVALTRDHPVVAVNDPTGVQPQGPLSPGTALSATTPLTGLKYNDSSRATLDLDWRRTFILPVGLRLDPFVSGRADQYAIGSARRVLVALNGAQTDLGAAKANSARSFGTVGVDLSYPLIRPFGNGGSILLEPLAQIALSPRSKLNTNIPNEDSTTVEFDESNLFSTNRFPGYDLYEGGARYNLAGRATVDFGAGRTASLLVGKSYRDQVETQFSPLSGLRGTSSDWITYATLQPMPGLSFFNRARLDKDSFTVQREEAGVNLGVGKFFGSVRYNYNTSGLTYKSTGVAPNLIYSTVVGRIEDLQASGNLFIAKNWGLTANASRDMRTHVFPMAQAGIFYQDDCIRIDMLYTHDETFRGFGAKVGASDSIGFRLSVVTLGDTPAVGGRRYDVR